MNNLTIFPLNEVVCNYRIKCKELQGTNVFAKKVVRTAIKDGHFSGFEAAYLASRIIDTCYLFLSMITRTIKV